MLERPKVFYNAATNKYVMYIHIDGNTPEGSYKIARVGVAAATPWMAVKNTCEASARSAMRAATSVSLSTTTERRISSSKIARSASISRVFQPIPLRRKRDVSHPAHMEGGAIVHYDGVYYVIGSALTGCNPNPNKYATARILQGPWSEFRDIAPPETKTYGSQSTMQLKIAGTKKTSVIFMGDIWKPHPVGFPLPLDAGGNRRRQLASARTEAVHHRCRHRRTRVQ